MFVVVVVPLLVAMMVGCGRGVDRRESLLSAPTAGEAWRIYEKSEKPEDGFSIALPGTWSPAALTDEVRRAIHATLWGSVITLYVAAKRGDLRSFIVEELKPLDSLVPEFVAAHTAVLRTRPDVNTQVSHRRVSLAAGETEEFRYTTKVRTPLGLNEGVAVTDYFIFGELYVFLVHVTIPVGQVERLRPVIEKIGQSFQVL